MIKYLSVGLHIHTVFANFSAVDGYSMLGPRTGHTYVFV